MLIFDLVVLPIPTVEFINLLGGFFFSHARHYIRGRGTFAIFANPISAVNIPCAHSAAVVVSTKCIVKSVCHNFIFVMLSPLFLIQR